MMLLVTRDTGEAITMAVVLSRRPATVKEMRAIPLSRAAPSVGPFAIAKHTFKNADTRFSRQRSDAWRAPMHGEMSFRWRLFGQCTCAPVKDRLF